jgi:hypothetical protein
MQREKEKSIGSREMFILTTRIGRQKEQLNAAIASNDNEQISRIVESEAAWCIHLIRLIALAEASGNTSETLRTGTDNSPVVRVHNKQITISVEKDGTRTVQADRMV